MAAIYVQNAGNDTLYYAHIDYQGSLLALSLANGTVRERYAYDPWGKRRDPLNWTQADNRTSFILYRGYTFHEHLPEFNLINMNGRVYDPLVAQFLSPDPFLQAPGSWLNYNRYAYCFNNPLIYSDPDGEWIHIIIGAIVGGFANVIMNANNIENTGQFFTYFGIGAAVGAGSAALGGWVAGATKTAGIIPGMAIGAGTGAVSGAVTDVILNGFNNLVRGESFTNNWEQSAKSGAVSGAIAGGITGGISGYKTAKASGTNYWWGSEVKYGRNQCSFFTAEKPYEVVDFNIRNVGSKSLNDCVPTSFAEMNDYFGGNTTYEDYRAITNYQENVGVSRNRADYRELLSDNFNTSPYNNPSVLENLTTARDLQSSGYLLHTNMPYSNGLRHADNIRSISYYSNKVVLRYRIGSYKLSSVNNDWWFYLLRGLIR